MDKSWRQLVVLIIACAPYEVYARGGQGNETGFKFMLGIGAIVLIGWLLSQIRSDTRRALGGLLVLITAATVVGQFIARLVS